MRGFLMSGIFERNMKNNTTVVELGRTAGAYGVRGWIRVVPIDSGEVLLKVKSWVYTGMDGQTRDVKVLAARRHGDIIVAQFEGVEQKEDADQLRGQVGVERALFPKTAKDEVWAVDVIGCEVKNPAGVLLGEVEAIGNNGVQDLLNIRWTTPEGKTARFMIPMVKDVYLLDIDVENKVVTVDFEADWR